MEDPETTSTDGVEAALTASDTIKNVTSKLVDLCRQGTAGDIDIHASTIREILEKPENATSLNSMIFEAVQQSNVENLGGSIDNSDSTAVEVAQQYTHMGLTKEELTLLEAPVRDIQQKKEEELGADHEETLRASYHLAILLHALGQLDSSADIHKSIYDTRLSRLGEQHEDTFRSAHCLAGVLLAQRKYFDAEQYCDIAVNGKETFFGKNHLSTLQSKEILANVKRERKQFAESEILCKEVLAGYEAQLGIPHHDTLVAMDILGNLYRLMNKPKDSERLYRRAHGARVVVYGLDSLEAARSGLNLAMALHKLRRHADETETLLRTACDTFEQQLGGNAKDTLNAYHSLGLVLNGLEQHEDAEAAFQKAADGRTTLLGANHYDTLQSVQGLASAMKANGKNAAAEEQMFILWDMRSKTFGRNNQLTLNSAYLYGVICCENKKFSDAEKPLKDAYYGRGKTAGANHRDTLDAGHQLVIALLKLNDFNQAQDLCEKIIIRTKKTLPEDHPVVQEREALMKEILETRTTGTQRLQRKASERTVKTGVTTMEGDDSPLIALVAIDMDAAADEQKERNKCCCVM
eukprot:GEMP01015772.1.p1 GENE.GEMP01015772.1~~GEMP01015772.1.p1  ORF type:complete len:579 (+),score=150.82 GEMP01015772.1:128-1864(+)